MLGATLSPATAARIQQQAPNERVARTGLGVVVRNVLPGERRVVQQDRIDLSEKRSDDGKTVERKIHRH
jgi:hypothetical protein